MNLLKNTIVYLAGALENATDGESWRNRLAPQLENLGVKVLDPTKQMFFAQSAETPEIREQLKIWRQEGNFSAIHDFMKEVIRRDLRAVDISTFIVCKLEPDIPSFGTIHEVVVAATQRKPLLFILEDKKKMPLWLIGMVNMDYVFDSEWGLLTYLKLANDGLIKLDTKYWKILA